MDTLELSTRCYSLYQVLQDQRQLPDGLGWSLNCRDGVTSDFAIRSLGDGKIMDQKHAIWIKDPLAILADGAERGIVVQNGRIVELVPRGGQPTTSAAFFEAGDHVILPGVINTHHHFYQTLARAVPGAPGRELVPSFHAPLPVLARPTPPAL